MGEKLEKKGNCLIFNAFMGRVWRGSITSPQVKAGLEAHASRTAPTGPRAECHAGRAAPRYFSCHLESLLQSGVHFGGFFTSRVPIKGNRADRDKATHVADDWPYVCRGAGRSGSRFSKRGAGRRERVGMGWD